VGQCAGRWAVDSCEGVRAHTDRVEVEAPLGSARVAGLVYEYLVIPSADAVHQPLTHEDYLKSPLLLWLYTYVRVGRNNVFCNKGLIVVAFIASVRNGVV
jgi:hypothetical protein